MYSLERIRSASLIFLFYFCVYQSSTVNADIITDTNKLNTLRLPNNTVPILYNISFIIDEYSTEFFGYTNIEILIKNTTDKIILHSRHLENFKIHISDFETGEDIQNIVYKYDNRTHFLIIYSDVRNFTFEINKKFIISIKYEGRILEDIPKGIYKSKTENSKMIVITQFEPTFARRAFPCFDEPNFKSQFIITVTHSSDYTAISNMPLDGEPTTSENGKVKTTKFQQTPIMSTYLLAFTLHDYLNASTEINNITQTVYYLNPKDQIRAAHTANKSAEIMSAMEDLFGINYPLTKLGQIGVPKSYGSGMENWGLIIYDQKRSMINLKCKSTSDFSNIITITHEMVHQWFGNLVSPKWWTYIWLNEGFATYYSYVIAHKVFPKCQVEQHYQADSLSIAYYYHRKHQLSEYIEEETNIRDRFDNVSYDRAAAVLRMISHILTEKTFQRGITKYLEKNKYSAASEDDLFECLEKVALQDNIKFFNTPGVLTKLLKTWTNNKGFPIIRVTRNYETGEITLTQDANLKNYSKTWYIPMNFATATDNSFESTEIDYIMPPTRTVTIYPDFLNITLQSHDWLILNKQNLGFYRVLYDKENWLMIAQALRKNPKSIHLNNRVQLIRDVMSGFNLKLVDDETVFEIVSYLKYENEFLPWAEAGWKLNNILETFVGLESFYLVKLFMHDIVRPVFSKLVQTPLEDETSLHNLVKIEVYRLACRVDIDECLNYSYDQLKCFLESGNFYKCFTSSNIICGGVKKARTEEIKQALEKILIIENLPEMEAYLTPFLCTDNREHILMILDSIIKLFKTAEKPRDFYLIYIAIYMVYTSNDIAQEIAIDFILENFDELSKNPKHMTDLIGKLGLLIQEEQVAKAKYMILVQKYELSFGSNVKIDSKKLEIINMILDSRNEAIENFDDTFYWLIQYKNKLDKKKLNNTLEQIS